MTTPSRGHNGKFTRTADTARRDAEACELRARGASYQQIADRLGYGDRSLAYRAVQRALTAVVVEDVEMLRTLECERLDEMTRHAWAVMADEHVLVDHGHVVHGPDGKPLIDWRPTLRAVDTLLKVSERRSRLLGLDAPARTRVQVVSESDVDAAIAELSAEIAARAAGEGT